MLKIHRLSEELIQSLRSFDGDTKPPVSIYRKLCKAGSVPPPWLAKPFQAFISSPRDADARSRLIQLLERKYGGCATLEPEDSPGWDASLRVVQEDQADGDSPAGDESDGPAEGEGSGLGCDSFDPE